MRKRPLIPTWERLFLELFFNQKCSFVWLHNVYLYLIYTYSLRWTFFVVYNCYMPYVLKSLKKNEWMHNSFTLTLLRFYFFPFCLSVYRLWRTNTVINIELLIIPYTFPKMLTWIIIIFWFDVENELNASLLLKTYHLGTPPSPDHC